MSKSQDRAITTVRAVVEFVQALSRAQTCEQVFAYGLNAIHEVLKPDSAFVVLPESGSPDGRVASSIEHRPAWITDLSIPVLMAGQPAGRFVVHFEHAYALTEFDITLIDLVTTETAASLDRLRERDGFEETLRGKCESVAMAVHELRAPLTAIIGAAFLLRSGQDHDHAIQIIDRSARIQEQLIGDLLNLSRLDAGGIELHLAVMDLAAIVEQVVEQIRPVAAASSVSVITHLETPMMVRADAQKLWQIFWNLLSNSVRFAAANGEIRVIGGIEEGLAKVSVEDNGCGIEKERLPYIFERFAQAHEPRPQAYDGFGLGLAVVKEFVSILEGTVTGESDGPGKGAAFTIRLPWVP